MTGDDPETTALAPGNGRRDGEGRPSSASSPPPTTVVPSQRSAPGPTPTPASGTPRPGRRGWSVDPWPTVDDGGQGRPAPQRSAQDRSAAQRTEEQRTEQERPRQRPDGRNTDGRRPAQERPSRQTSGRQQPARQRPDQQRPDQQRPDQQRPDRQAPTPPHATTPRSAPPRSTPPRGTPVRDVGRRGGDRGSDRGGSRERGAGNRLESGTTTWAMRLGLRPRRKEPSGPDAPRLEVATTWLRFMESRSDNPVFVDGSGRRRWLWRLVGVVVALACVAFVALVLVTVLGGSPAKLAPGSLGSEPAPAAVTGDGS